MSAEDSHWVFVGGTLLIWLACKILRSAVHRSFSVAQGVAVKLDRYITSN